MKSKIPPLIYGNWKTYITSLKQAEEIVAKIDETLKKTSEQKMYSLAVPEAFIHPLSKHIKRGTIGSQNITGTQDGAFTGTSNAQIIKSAGATFTILGHSETRARGETNAMICEKLTHTLSQNITSILCVGEKDRLKKQYLDDVISDLKECLNCIPREHVNNLIIAYEPLWAIGQDTPATKEQCFEVMVALRRYLAIEYHIDFAKHIKMLYGGSVTKDNAHYYIDEGGVNGLLIGRASVDPEQFSELILSFYES